MQFRSCFKVWLKQNSFDKEDFDCNYNTIYLTFFCWLLQFFTFSDKKCQSNKHLIQLFIFIFASKPSFLSLQLTSSKYSVDQLPGKIKQLNIFDSKFAQKMDLGLEFQKTNVCVCVCVCVCQFSWQNKPLWLSYPKLSQKIDLELEIQKN